MMKLVKDLTARTYELTYLVPASFTEGELSTLKDKITQLVAKHKGKIANTEDWGKKNLAYSIRHKSKSQTQAVYVHHLIEMTSNEAVAFEKEVYLEPNIMRHLMLKAELPKVAKTAPVKAEIKPAKIVKKIAKSEEK